MPECSPGWSPAITRNLAGKLADILPESGAWVSFDWLICRTSPLVPIFHATANYHRWAALRRPDDGELPIERRAAIGHRWLLLDVLRSRRVASQLEWNGVKDHKGRRYRRRVPPDAEAAELGLPHPEIRILPWENLRATEETQVREEIDPALVRSLAAAYDAGNPLPPPLLVVQEGEVFWLADGFHRRRALEQLGRLNAECEVHVGTFQLARTLAARANRGSAKQPSALTPAGKRRAVLFALQANPTWSDNRVAAWVGVHDSVVQSVRGEIQPHRKEELSGSRSGNPTIPPTEVVEPVRQTKREGVDGRMYPATRESCTEEETLQRQNRVLELKESGMSFRAIAEQVGGGKDRARQDYKAASARRESGAGERASVASLASEGDGDALTPPLVAESRTMRELRRAWAKATPEERTLFLQEIRP